MSATINGLFRLGSGKVLNVHSQGTGPALLFLHGLGSSLNFWGATIDAADLTNRYRVVRYDFDGAGSSPLSSGSLSIASLAQDAIDLLDTLKIEKASIIGHSMSGLVVSTIASKWPQRVDKLVLVGAITTLPEQGAQMMRGRAETARSENGMFQLADAVPTNAFSRHSKTHARLAYAFVRTLVSTTKPEGYAAACFAIADATNPEYGAITAPTLVLHGAEDPLSNEKTNERYKREIPNCTVVTLQDVGHWHSVEDPQKTADAISSFLDRDSSARM